MEVDNPQAETKNRWEEIKPEFMRLYIYEGKSLAKVRHELRERYKFNASKSAFTRQIKIWKAFKNIKASEAHRLALQRKAGQRPELDYWGRPIPWDRVARATKVPSIASRLSSPPTDLESRVVHLVSDIWRESTIRFATQNPETEQYQKQYITYGRLIQSMELITMSFGMEFPRKEVNYICNVLFFLVVYQPAMACEVFILLIRKDPAEPSGYLSQLKDHIFEYFCALATARLPPTNPLRQLLTSYSSRKDYTNLGGAIARAKLDAMWNTSIAEIGQGHHQRLFFREVLMRAVLVMTEYGLTTHAPKSLPRLTSSPGQDTAAFDLGATLDEMFSSPGVSTNSKGLPLDTGYG